MIDVEVATALLAEIFVLEEKIADRGPIKVLPRPSSDIPNVPELQAAIETRRAKLRVCRNYSDAKGHELQLPAQGAEYDLKEIGVVDEIKNIEVGKDRANPKSSTIVRVEFPSGAHLWFDPNDLDLVE